MFIYFLYALKDNHNTKSFEITVRTENVYVSLIQQIVFDNYVIKYNKIGLLILSVRPS